MWRWLRARLTDVWSELDLVALLVAGVLFTVLGALGIADVKTLSSVVLALLAILAFAQIRTRRTLAELSKRMVSGSNIYTDFPPDLAGRRALATDYLFIGISMRRASRTASGAMRDILHRGGQVRVVLLNPAAESLVRSAAAHTTTADGLRLQSWIRGTIDELRYVANGHNDRLQIRTVDFVPRFGAHAIDKDTTTGVIYLQHYEHRPSSNEPCPIVELRPTDGHWYHHFKAELDRIWESGSDYPNSR